jgi:hypothetical protein
MCTIWTSGRLASHLVSDSTLLSEERTIALLTPPPVADHRNAPVNALGYLRVMFAAHRTMNGQAGAHTLDQSHPLFEPPLSANLKT